MGATVGGDLPGDTVRTVTDRPWQSDACALVEAFRRAERDTFGLVGAGAEINGSLTFPANRHGNPAISVPAGLLDGRPIGLQLGRRFDEQLLLDLALVVERNRACPLTTRTSPTIDAEEAT